MSKTALLELYTSVLRNWTVHLQARESRRRPPSSQHRKAEDPTTTWTRLVKDADTLCLSLLESTDPPGSIQVQPAILNFYEVLATSSAITVKNPKAQPGPPIILPSAPIVYHLLFTPSLSVLSRLCSILTAYKRALDHHSSSSSVPSQAAAQFKSLLSEVSQCIWHDAAFSRSDPTSATYLMPRRIISILEKYSQGEEKSDHNSIPLDSVFSISHSTALSALNFAFFFQHVLPPSEHMIDPRRHATAPATRETLAALQQKKKKQQQGGLDLSWDDYRRRFLTWLEQERGVVGFKEFNEGVTPD